MYPPLPCVRVEEILQNDDHREDAAGVLPRGNQVLFLEKGVGPEGEVGDRSERPRHYRTARVHPEPEVLDELRR